MEKLKQVLSGVPLIVWGILGVILLVGFFWFSDDVGSWWEKRQQEKFDKADAGKQQQIDALTKERDELKLKASQAEAREQGKIVEADLLRQEAAKRGVNIEKAQQAISDAQKKYTEDLETIEKVNTGEISNLDLCLLQCDSSAKVGYPCRPSYCDKFK
jgi:hypothetical protein